MGRQYSKEICKHNGMAVIRRKVKAQQDNNNEKQIL